MPIYYNMRGKDGYCESLTYREWTVSGAPDETGAQYNLLDGYCGDSLNLQDIIVVSTWDDGTNDGLSDVLAYGAIGDGITDDTAAIQAALTANAGVRETFFPPGTYKITTALSVLPYQDIRGAGTTKTRLVGTFTSGDQTGMLNSAATIPSGASDTTTNGSVAVGGTVLTLTSMAIGASGGNVAVGDTIFIGETNRYFYYEVMARDLGALTVTIDRPLVTAYASGTAVGVRVDNKDIHISDLWISGKSGRAINLPAAHRCLIENVRVTPDDSGNFFTDTPVSFDIGGRFSTMRQLYIDNDGYGLSCVSIESGENCVLDQIEARRSATNYAGILIGVAYYCKIINSRAVNCYHGLWLNSGGGLDIYGCRYNQIDNCEFREGTGTGIYILNGSSFNSFVNVVSTRNAGFGVYIAPGIDDAEPSRDNSFVNTDVSGNTGGGFQTLTGSGTKASKDTLITNLTCIGGGGFALDCGGSVTINGIIAKTNPSGAVQVSGAATLMAKNMQLEPTNDAAFWAGFVLNTTGDVSINGLRGTSVGSGTKLMFSHTACLLSIDDVLLLGSSYSHGYSSAASANARLRRSSRVDMSAAATPYLLGAGSVQIVAPGTINTIMFVVGTSATTDSTDLLPADGYVLDCMVKIITPFSGGSTMSIGQAGSTSLFAATTDINTTGTAGDIYKIEQITQSFGALAIRATVGGSPSVGQALVLVKWSQPSA